MMAHIKEIAAKTPTDMIILRWIYQHQKMAAINPCSVNTLRLYSLVGKDGSVKVYSAVLRTGVGDTKVDNYSSRGLSVGITEEVKLRNVALNKFGEQVINLTPGLVFENYSIPSYDQAAELEKSTCVGSTLSIRILGYRNHFGWIDNYD